MKTHYQPQACANCGGKTFTVYQTYAAERTYIAYGHLVDQPEIWVGSWNDDTDEHIEVQEEFVRCDTCHTCVPDVYHIQRQNPTSLAESTPQEDLPLAQMSDPTA